MGHSAGRAYNYHHHTQLGPIRPCQKKEVWNFHFSLYNFKLL